MQESTEEAEASIPTENVEDSPNPNGTFALCRKAAKRTLPWDLKAGELDLLSPPQAEDIPATKKRRLEEPFSATTDEAAAKISSHDTAVSLSAATASSSPTDAVTVKGIGAIGRWTPEEDEKLKSAVAKTCKKKHGGKYTLDWDAITALVPSRTQKQCCNRWHDVLVCSMTGSNARTRKWTADEDSKLKDAVQTNGGKHWAATAALVPGRTRTQCRDRWKDVFDYSIDRRNERSGKWSEDEDSKLKDSVQLHGGKDFSAIASLVPGRVS
jgi:hypothetical protein